jgi:3-methyladenine DNA glycosylase AlkD
MKNSKSPTPENTNTGEKETSRSAAQFIGALQSHQSLHELKKNQRYYPEADGDKCLGVRMKVIFDTAREFIKLPLAEVEKLFESQWYEIRMGAVSIMDFKAREKTITPGEREQLYNLYLENHKRINNWDLVDRGAPHIVGGYLADKSRAILYKLAKSKNVWERRTAIVSTWYFIRKGDIEDTFKLAEKLVKDPHDMIQKATGSWLREAGKRDAKRLIGFLDRHAGHMPRTMLRYAVEKLPKKKKDFYLSR